MLYEVITLALGRLFDLCLLIETDAFLSSSSRCELDVMAGVAHQVRNPLTIIGVITSYSIHYTKLYDAR